MADWLDYTQSIIFGLTVSFLLAKLFSILFTSSDEPNPNETLANIVSPDFRRKKAERDKKLIELRRQIAPTVIVDNEDDWDCVVMTELDAKFCAATEFVASDPSVKKTKVPNSVRLKIYGLYKVATEGGCLAPQPPVFMITARAKWNAWNELGAMAQEEAIKKYLEIITELYPNWADASTSMKSGGGNNETSSKDTRPVGPEIRSCVDEEEFKLDAMHDNSKEESADQTPLHSAVDRDQTDVAEIPLSRNADLSPKDNEGLTPLHHVAVSEPEDTDVKLNAIQDDDDRGTEGD